MFLLSRVQESFIPNPLVQLAFWDLWSNGETVGWTVHLQGGKEKVVGFISPLQPFFRSIPSVYLHRLVPRIPDK